MSVQVNTYVMCGAVLPYDVLYGDEWDGKLDPYLDSARGPIHHHNRLCVLVDGMNGEYVAIGRVLAKTEEGQPFTAPIQCRFPTEDQGAQHMQIAMDMHELLGDAMASVGLIGWHVISHYR